MTGGLDGPKNSQVPIAVCRQRYWVAAAQILLGRHLGIYLTRYLVLMLISASRAYCGKRTNSNKVSNRVKRHAKWLAEHDPGPVAEFEDEEENGFVGLEEGKSSGQRKKTRRKQEQKKRKVTEAGVDHNDGHQRAKKRARFGPPKPNEDAEVVLRPKQP